jgi:hypothetical protein
MADPAPGAAVFNEALRVPGGLSCNTRVMHRMRPGKSGRVVHVVRLNDSWRGALGHVNPEKRDA